jgi:hypothetical protein
MTKQEYLLTEKDVMQRCETSAGGLLSSEAAPRLAENGGSHYLRCIWRNRRYGDNPYRCCPQCCFGDCARKQGRESN